MLSRSTLIFVALLTMVVTRSSAQYTGTIKGRLVDTAGHQLLRDAFLILTNISDTTWKKKCFSREDATFEVSQLPYGSYFIRITFQGFEPDSQHVSLDKEHPVLDMGDIYLKIRVRVLDSVRVEESPMILKKDTIEYNASRFKTRSYAPLSDLMEILPGIRVNNDGTISMNGRPVDQLLVDGKPFFEGDPQMALRHLPAEIIRKIQVYPTTYEQMGLSGPPGLAGGKTINLILKSNRRKGDFGKLAVGAGTGGAYAGSMDLNHMNGVQQISVIGDAGNVDGLNTDRPGDAMNTTGNGRYGITRKWNAGINYRDTWNDHATIYGSYVNSQQQTQSVQRMHSLNIFPNDSSTSLDQNSTALSKNGLQRMNLTLENKFSPSNSLFFRPNISLQHTESYSTQQGTATYTQTAAPVYQSSGNNSSTSDNSTISAGLQYLHKGSQLLRSFSVGLDVVSDHNERSGFNFSKTNFSAPSATTNSLNQHSANSGSSLAISPSFSYTLPLGANDALDLLGNYLYNRSSASNQTFRFNDITQKFDQPDQGQSNDFNNIYYAAKALVNYRIHWGHVGIGLGNGIESDQLQGKNVTKNSTIESHYLSMLPSASLHIDLANNKSLQLFYSGKPVPLTVQQLQPVSATTDSLFIQQGNPQLKQPFTHSFSLSYNALNTRTQTFFTAMVSGSVTANAVQNSITLLSNGAQVTMPVNLNGAGNVSANFNYTIPASKLHSTFTLGGDLRYSQDPGLNNGLQNNTHMMNFSGTLSWDLHSPAGIDCRVSTTSEYYIVHYPLDSNRVTGYFTETLSSRLTYTRGDWTGSLTGFYTLNNSLPKGFQPLAPILSPAISRRLLNRKAAEIRLSVTDMLNQQSGASRTTTPNAIIDMWSVTRGRYVLLSFIYNLSRFGISK